MSKVKVPRTSRPSATERHGLLGGDDLISRVHPSAGPASRSVWVTTLDGLAVCTLLGSRVVGMTHLHAPLPDLHDLKSKVCNWLVLG